MDIDADGYDDELLVCDRFLNYSLEQHHFYFVLMIVLYADELIDSIHSWAVVAVFAVD
ncbi:hypothetical protein RintRC_3483 [Richelia intracellularis]|nr:hypothetical protein RintRC_3483 [Richelia intracellularis]